MKAVIFDFDGTIIDTETPEYISWDETFRSYGCILPRDEYSAVIGTADSVFDIYHCLERLCGHEVDRAAVKEAQVSIYWRLLGEQPLREGIHEWISDAESIGLRLGVASCSKTTKILKLMEPYELHHKFEYLATGDSILKLKPDPEVYLLALERLGVSADEALAIEDSPNGVMAAKSAGIFCVCVPNGMTAGLAFMREPDMRLTSLADIRLADVLALPQLNLSQPHECEK